jgi:2-succinyl-6-hydroxy-2,4-cyclohexadiene-1-carboxylate synthase
LTTVLLHGFTQTARSWDPVVRFLSNPDVVALDMPGHGKASATTTDLPSTADRIVRGHPGATFVGYSMGGRLALHMGIREPRAVGGLVLIGASPGIEDSSERETRRRSDAELATRIEEIGVERFLDEWLAQPLFANLPVDRADVENRATNTAAGLAWSLRHWGTGSQESLWGLLDRITCPVLLITGGLDIKFTDIARRMSGLIRSCRHVVIEGAGHSVHLEQPERVARLVEEHITRDG